MPLASFGAIAYFIVFSAATLAAFGYRGAGKFALLVVSLMFLFTLWLIYLQAFVIKAFCQFCLLSALVTTVMTVLLVMANRRRAQYDMKVSEVDKVPRILTGQEGGFSPLL